MSLVSVIGLQLSQQAALLDAYSVVYQVNLEDKTVRASVPELEFPNVPCVTNTPVYERKCMVLADVQVSLFPYDTPPIPVPGLLPILRNQYLYKELVTTEKVFQPFSPWIFYDGDIYTIGQLVDALTNGETTYILKQFTITFEEVDVNIN
jgi:hypothetical protein